MFEAEAVSATNPRPNTKGRAYEIDTRHAAEVLMGAGHQEAAAYFDGLNRFPAMQRLGFCVETAAAEATSEPVKKWKPPEKKSSGSSYRSYSGGICTDPYCDGC